MSWMKHRAVPGSGGSGRQPPTSATPPMSPVQMYNPNQHSNHQLNSQWQQIDLSTPSANTWYGNQQPPQQQNNWYQPQQQAYQHPAQHFSNQQQSTAPYYPQQTEQPHYQQVPQQSYQQQQEPPMQPFMNSSSVSNVVDNKSDAWNEWNNWGDDDNSNNKQHVPDEALNANVKQEFVEDSFAASQSWNLVVDDKNQSTAQLAENDQHANDIFPKVQIKNEPQNVDYGKSDQLNKFAKSETLTPQWSIESQPSQDSSTDDVALLQSDTEQKHLSNTTNSTTTTNNSNPASSSDLTSPTTNTNSLTSENKEIIGQNSGYLGVTNSITNTIVPLDVQNVRNNKRISAQIRGAQEQAGSTSEQLTRPSNRNNIINIQSTPDNMEVPSSTLLQSERNQYLETGQLIGDNGTDADSSQAPPPAFSRVVVGQRESSDDMRFGGTGQRTLPAGSDVGARTSTYRPRGDTSDDDEDSAFDDNEPLAPSFPTQPILPRSATIGAETLTSTPYPASTTPHVNFQQEQRDTHLDGANTLDDLNNLSVQQPDLNAQQAGVGGSEVLLLPPPSGSSTGEVGSGPEGQEEDAAFDALAGGVRQMMVTENDHQNGQGRGLGGNDTTVLAPRRSSKHTNDSSEDLPPSHHHQPVSDDHLPTTSQRNVKQQQTRQQSSSNSSNKNKPRGRYTPPNNGEEQQQQHQQQDRSDRRPPDSQRRPTNSRGDRRRGGGDYRRRDRSEDSDYESREAGGLISGEENKRGGEHLNHMRRRRGEDDARRHNKGGDRDRYRHRDDPHNSSYYRPNNRRDEYDDYADDLAGGASRASSRSESLQDMYRNDRRNDRDRDRNRDRDTRRHNRDGDRRDKQGREGYVPRGDPYGGRGGGYMQGYYDPYGQPSAQSYYYQQQQYQYYENLRITNPQAYAEWYRKFYQGQQHGVQRGPVSGTTAIAEDRASIHSGRSSTNDDLAKERYLRQSYYGGHSGAAMMHQQHNSTVGHYHSLNRDSASMSSHYGLDDSRHHDYPDSATLNDSSTTTFQPIDTSSTSLSNYGLHAIAQPPQQQQRDSPAKFSTAHAIGALSSAVTGQLIHVPVQYPLDGEGSVVHLVGLGELLGEDGEYGEMVRFPGPLVRGVTHKKTVIEYCEEKIRTAREDITIDCDSYILLWELLILLLSHNGVVVGADISDLLMRHDVNRQPQTDQAIRPSSVMSNTSSNACIDHNSNSETTNLNAANDNKLGNALGIKEDAITNKFRQYLIYGSVKEALEWAMKNGLWGHALFLASKLDKRTYANVMKRFANGLPINDPLQTLYQHLSGSIPAAVTCLAEERWGDWRPHLAMILANASSNPDLDRRSILSLGDTLDTRGSIYAGQFCYLMAQVEFSDGKLSNSTGGGDEGNHRLVLLGGDRNVLAGNVNRYARTEAIHMTEVYEYACGLNGDGFYIPTFQTYKYLLATRLCDHGLVERALAYLERIATIILANQSAESSQNTSTVTGTSGSTASTVFHPVLVSKVCLLADRLRYCDPSGELEQGEDDGDGNNGWLERIVKLDRDYSMGLISHSTTQNQETDNSQQCIGTAEELTYDQKIWQQPQEHQQMATPQQQWQQQDQKQQQQQQQLLLQQQQPFDPNYQQQQHFSLDRTLTEGQSDYNQQQQDVWSSRSQQLSYNNPAVTDHLQSSDSLQWNHTQTEPTTPVVTSKGDSSRPSSPKRPSDDVPQQRQQISMPNQSSRKAYDNMDDDDDTTSGPKSLQTPSAKIQSAQQTAKTTSKNENKGWLDGIFGRFSMRPKNQMKLPDDKNPTIVWDPAKKRWINTEEDGVDAAAELRPPPKMAELMPQQRVQQQPMSLPAMNMPNTANSVAPSMMSNNGLNMATLAETQTSTFDANAVTGKPPIPVGNMFKMQRGRNLKKSYVDVFNPVGISSSAASAPALLADGNAGNAVHSATSGVVPNFFIPQTVADPNAPMDFLTPTTGMLSLEHQHQYEKN